MTATDLGQGGIGLESSSMVYPGTIGVILMTKQNSEVLLRGFEVLHCRYAGQCRHVIGAKWTQLPADLPLRAKSTVDGPRLVLQRGPGP